MHFDNHTTQIFGEIVSSVLKRGMKDRGLCEEEKHEKPYSGWKAEGVKEKVGRVVEGIKEAQQVVVRKKDEKMGCPIYLHVEKGLTQTLGHRFLSPHHLPFLSYRASKL